MPSTLAAAAAGSACASKHPGAAQSGCALAGPQVARPALWSRVVQQDSHQKCRYVTCQCVSTGGQGAFVPDRYILAELPPPPQSRGGGSSSLHPASLKAPTRYQAGRSEARHVPAGPQKLDDESKSAVADGLARAVAHMGPVRSKEAALLLTQPFVQRAQSALASGEGVCLGASLRGRHSVCMLVLQVSCFSAAGSGIGVWDQDIRFWGVLQGGAVTQAGALLQLRALCILCRPQVQGRHV